MAKLVQILPPSLPMPPLKGGSIQTIVYDVIKNLKRFEIITFSKKERGYPDEKIDEYGIKHIYINNRSFDNLEILFRGEYLIRYNRYIYKIIEKLKEIKPDIIHVHNRPHFVPLLRNALGPDVKIILTDQNQKIAEDKYNLKRIGSIIDSLDEVVAPSKRILELDLLKSFPLIIQQVFGNVLAYFPIADRLLLLHFILSFCYLLLY